MFSFEDDEDDINIVILVDGYFEIPIQSCVSFVDYFGIEKKVRYFQIGIFYFNQHLQTFFNLKNGDKIQWKVEKDILVLRKV
jgi:hypothetical protein